MCYVTKTSGGCLGRPTAYTTALIKLMSQASTCGPRALLQVRQNSGMRMFLLRVKPCQCCQHEIAADKNHEKKSIQSAAV